MGTLVCLKWYLLTQNLLLLRLEIIIQYFLETVYLTNCLCGCTSSIIGKLIEIEHQNTLHTTMRPGWEDLVRRCMQMFLNRSDGQPWSYKRHYQDGM